MIKRFFRRISPLIALLLLASLTWKAQSHLNDLQQFTYENLIAETMATITDITAPDADSDMNTPSNFRARITLTYEVLGKEYGRVLMAEITDKPLPKIGDSWPIYYIKAQPETALLADELANIDDQISGMQILVFALGIASLMSPFMLLGFARKRV